MSSEPSIVEVNRYKKWEIGITVLFIYKNSRRIKLRSYGYRFYNGDSLITSSGIHFLTEEVAFEKGKRKIDELLKNKRLNKPNKLIKGESMGFGKAAQKALNDQKEEKKNGSSAAKTTKRQKVSDKAKSNNKTAGNKASGKRSTTDNATKATKATKAAKAPTTKAPSGNGSDVKKPEQKINNVKGEVKMSKAVAKATNAVTRESKNVANNENKVNGIRLAISAVIETRKHTVNQGVVLLGAYGTGITSITTLASEGAVTKEVIKAISDLPNALKKSTADEARQVKLLSAAIEKLDAAKEKLAEVQDELKDVIAAEKNAD